MKKEIHTLIIWSAAAAKKEEIEKQISDKFNILKEYTCNWEKKSFQKNLMGFYAHSQKDKDLESFKKVIEGKIQHCGDGEFYLFVLEDHSPNYEYRDTSNGKRKINTNVFDLKAKLRDLTGGGHKIHASDNTFESNKDLTQLLGKNTEDFLNATNFLVKKEKLSRNCLGTDGFNSIEELFYLLNNSIDYVVLRNFECLPKEYTLEGHGDIDLLVEDLNFIRYLTHAQPVFPELDYRVYYEIKIGKTIIPFDFRHVGDDYYDIYWQNNILKNNDLFKNLVQTPNSKDHFYSLLYHAYVQKKEIKEDYYPKLEELAAEIDVNYSRNSTIEDVKVLLDGFINENDYKYTIPNDSTVTFNYSFSKSNFNTDYYGIRLSSLLVRHEKDIYFSEVFHDVKNKKITKLCSSHIGRNENRFLKLIEKYCIAPQVISFTDGEASSAVEMEFIEGVGLNRLNNYGSFWQKKNVKKLINEALIILIILKENKIEHRDIKPDNLILVHRNNQFKLKIIDFGWSELENERNSITPEMLNEKFRKKDDEHSDIYSMQETLKYIFDGFPSIQQYIDSLFLKQDLNIAKNLLQVKGFTLKPKEVAKWILKKQTKFNDWLHNLYYKLK